MHPIEVLGSFGSTGVREAGMMSRVPFSGLV
jgi:hypothetical protein